VIQPLSEPKRTHCSPVDGLHGNIASCSYIAARHPRRPNVIPCCACMGHYLAKGLYATILCYKTLKFLLGHPVFVWLFYSMCWRFLCNMHMSWNFHTGTSGYSNMLLWCGIYPTLNFAMFNLWFLLQWQFFPWNSLETAMQRGNWMTRQYMEEADNNGCLHNWKFCDPNVTQQGLPTFSNHMTFAASLTSNWLCSWERNTGLAKHSHGNCFLSWGNT
jgi:hypothetical protein